jgi:hypothetical protein
MNKIAELNDQFRQTFRGGEVLTTAGAIAKEDLNQIYLKVRQYDDFNEENGPYSEHDFGVFELADGQKIFWKIDYYAKINGFQVVDTGSSDPSNPEITARVLTIMLAEEY